MSCLLADRWFYWKCAAVSVTKSLLFDVDQVKQLSIFITDAQLFNTVTVPQLHGCAVKHLQ